MSETIRPATIDDAPALGALHVACWREAYAGHLSAEFLARETPESSAERWVRTITRVVGEGGAPPLLAELDGALLGFAMGGPARLEKAPRDTELYALYTRASTHGSGLGQRLLDAAIGGRPAFLGVLDRNPRATAFYERNGFRFDGTTAILPEFENQIERRMVR
ncbi:GNAT family N-acetyltransferase [Microcella daejeonensis]|uniref:GNAT family N-acetyltransferase n=1 Tax=Microcella daejeonensis TaxID=2994971 RepID=A0A9E8SA15_9MICO|nr:GNAT family N-acetyltransferase [Microcella daejeonensis]WAB82609.1 GNAT family N-acetyltransferase [Microcella daejeonensis]WAB84784.1 GNAT family N-acetyltransferase [Microcella daejeonensis]